MTSLCSCRMFIMMICLPASYTLRAILHCQVLHIHLRLSPVYGAPDTSIWMVLEGYHTVKWKTDRGLTANTTLEVAPVGFELLNGPFDKHLSRTEHIAEFPMSGTIDWKTPFALKDQGKEMKPLLMWVDTFIPWTQMSQHRNWLPPWMKGIKWFWRLAVLIVKTRLVLEYERRYSPHNYINCGSLLIDSTEVHILSVTMELLEEDVWNTCDGHQHQHMDYSLSNPNDNYVQGTLACSEVVDIGR